MTSAFSFHVIHDAVDHDLNPLRVAIASLRPRVINIVGGARKTQAFTFAMELQKNYPDMRVIFRNYPDDGNHARPNYELKYHRDAFGNLIVDDYSGCQRWIDDNQNYLIAKLTVLTDNESVRDEMDVYAAWQAKIMDLCGAKGWRVAVGRFAVGNPREADYARMGAMWKALAKWHPLHTFSPNEYIPQDIADAGGMVGRFTQGIDAAKAIGAWPFDVSIGEYGVVYRKPDGGLDADAGYSDPRIGWSGNKAFNYLYNQWVKWYKPHGVDVAVYCWGDDTGGKWSRFRVDTDNGFIKALTDANNRGELEPMVLPTTPITPNYTPVEFVAGKQYKIEAGAVRNLREKPSTGTTEIVGKVSGGDVVTALEQKIVGADYWWKITKTVTSPETGTTATITGWLSHDNQSVSFIRLPEVVVPNPTPDPVYPPVALPAPFLEVSAEFAMKMAEAHRKTAHNMRIEAAGLLTTNTAISKQIAALEAVKESNVLQAQNLESGAQIHLEIFDNYKWIAEQTTPPVAA